MRDHDSGSNAQPATEPRVLIAPGSDQALLERLFCPDSLDIDDLTEAVRMLLGRMGESSLQPQNPSRSDLLSPAPGVSHVVETTTP